MRMFDVQGIEIRAPRATVFEFLRNPLDLTGEYFIWTTNMGGIGSRADAFIVKVPKEKLMGQ
jgi:hypothetical protein